MSNKSVNKVGLLLVGLLMTAHAAAQPLQQSSVNSTGPHAQATSQISVAATSMTSAPSSAVQVAAGRQEPNNQNASTLSNTSGFYTMMAASLGLVGFVIHRRRRIYER